MELQGADPTPEKIDTGGGDSGIQGDKVPERGHEGLDVAGRKPGYAAIKPEFILHDYKPKLQTEYLSPEVQKQMEVDGEDNAEGTSNKDEAGDAENSSNKKKLKGRNKQRPGKERVVAKERICPAIKEGRDCSFGNKCIFSHDKQEFMASKRPDLPGPCYNFEQFGHCRYSLACRFAKSHLTDDLENVTNKELYETSKGHAGKNFLPQDVKKLLWKKKYNFKKADNVVKTVQSNFRGWSYSGGQAKDPNANTKPDLSKTNAKQDLSKTNAKQDQFDSNGKPDNTESKSKPEDSNSDTIPANSDLDTKQKESNTNTTVNDSSAITEGLNSNSDATVDNSVSSAKPSENAPTFKSTTESTKYVYVGENETGKRTLGQITDEEMFPLRTSERVKIDFKNKLYLAPLTTLGNLPFRRVCKEYGVEVTCGEMALATQLLQAKQSEWSLLRRHESEDIFGAQICGGYPDTMTRCAQLLRETCDLDFIDINCGCPIDLIYSKGSGSALMDKATKLEQICRSMLGVMGDLPLSVKVRTGVFDHKNVAHSLIPRLRDAGVSLVTVHGRSREQRYTRKADWDYVSRCAQIASPMPLFGNGDILSYEEANLHMKTHGVSGVMIARGALIKPWIFTEIQEQRHWDISSSERYDMLKRFTNYGLEHWGSDHQGVESTRRFLLEWLSFLHRYIPVGLLEQVPQLISERPPYYMGRNDLETLMASRNCADWVKLSEMLLGPVPPSFRFLPKHKANAYQ